VPLLVTGGAICGLALARLLFELYPVQFTLLATWPGALGLALLTALLGLGAGLWLAARRPAANAWAGLALLLPLLAGLASGVNPLRTLTLLAGSIVLFALLSLLPPSPNPPGAAHTRIPSLFLFLFLLSLYFSGLAPAVGEADTFEFQVGIARLGIAHGSGYPLLMLIGRLFASLPLGGTLAFRANLTSALFGALAAAGALKLARRLGAGPLAALLAGLAFGLSPTLWSRAVEVEAYTLNAAFVTALLLLSLRLASPAAEEAHTAHRDLGLLALLFGLSLTNHLTTLLLAPAAGLATLVALRRIGQPAAWRTLAWMVLLFLVGISVYLYVPLRWPAVNNGEWMRLEQFANLLAGGEARGAFQGSLPWRDPGRYAIAWSKIVSEYGWAGLGLALAGLITLAAWKGSAFRLVLIALAYLPYLYFALAFNVPDPDYSAFFIPLHLMAAALLGVGAHGLASLAQPGPQRPGRRPKAPTPARLHRERLELAGGRRVEVLVTAPPPPPRDLAGFWHSAVLSAIALLPLASLWRTLPAVDQSRDWARYRLGELMLRQPLAPSAAVLADSQKIAPLYYLQVAEGVRPDLDIIVLPDEASYRVALDERLAAGQTVYLGRYLPGLGAGYSLRSLGPLAEVSPEPLVTTNLALTPPLDGLSLEGVELLGYSAADGLRGAPPGNVSLTLAWRAAVLPEAHLLVHLRLLAPSGTDPAPAIAWQSAGSVPVSGLYPTNAWRPGEVVTDFHLLPLSPTLPPGDYDLQVGLFPPFAPTSSESAWATLGALAVLPPAEPPRPTRLLRAQLGDHWLVGYDLPETAAPGARVPVTLYWLRTPAATPVTALGESRSLEAWPEGALAPLVYSHTAPLDGSVLALAVDTGSPARCGWLAPPSAACALPPVRVAGQAAAEGALNFGDQLLLRRVFLETTRAAPGGQVALTLEWQGLRTIAADYTVFVHLLGPDGQVHGQVDAWPVSGTRATSTWAPGDVITDPYRVTVPADAPPGAYHVEIGLYLLATGERLPVLNAAGEPVDDRALVPGLTITAP
jgi:hypothetical protein